MAVRTLLWFRNDLRLHDHPLLHVAAAAGPVLPVYLVPPRLLGRTRFFGYPRLRGPRAQFWLQTLADLRQALTAAGSTLLVRNGRPEDVLPALAAKWGATQVLCADECGTEEARETESVAAALAQHNVVFRSEDIGSLYHPDDLPFDLAHLPELFTNYRIRVEGSALVRRPLPPPAHIHTPDAPEAGPLPLLASWGLPEPLAALPFTGGETAGLARLQHYLWDADLLRRYKETRNGLLGNDFSSQLSPWLALGCLSPRQVWAEVQRYEQTRIRNESTYWLVFELLWRDYFRAVARKHGSRIFHAEGLQDLPFPWDDDPGLFGAWADGSTGYPAVDAAMRQLQTTGWMSNRARQWVASFLTKNLGLDWRMGAEWFESWLVDYDVASNYGNWLYAAGVGNDARGFRFFHILKQAEQYDPDGAFVRHWLPQLAQVPLSRVHAPWLLSSAEQERAGLRIGTDYPAPVVDLLASARTNERKYADAKADPRMRKGNFKLQKFVRRQENQNRRGRV